MWKKIKAFFERIKELMNGKPDKPVEPDVDKPVSVDDIGIELISWLGENFSKAQIYGKLIHTASLDNRFMHTGFSEYNWPVKNVSGVACDAQCCLFYERGGKVVGGKWDWWRAKGQPIKTLENVHSGYNGHTMPAHGTKVWTMIVSTNGKMRSNIKQVTWR
jgi:hypothetical protein